MKKHFSVILNEWKKIAKVVGIVQTYIILTLVYYFVLTPIGLLLQAANVFKTHSKKSYWVKIPKQKINLKDFTKQY